MTCAEKVQEYRTRALVLSMEEAANVPDQLLFPRQEVIDALLRLAAKYEQLALAQNNDRQS